MKSMVLTLCLSLLISAGLVPSAWAGLYDRDTLVMRSDIVKDKALTVNVVVGHLPTYPNSYYEKRIEWVTAALDKDPNQFELYDDLSVAYHRLKQFDQAIKVMDQKMARLDASIQAADTDQDYAQKERFKAYSNQASHYLAQWLYETSDRQNIATLEIAKRFLEEARQLSDEDEHPTEDVELDIINWLMAPPATRDQRGWINPDLFRFSAPLKKKVEYKQEDFRYLRLGLPQVIAQSNPDNPLMLDLYWNLYLTQVRREDLGLAFQMKTRLQQLIKNKHVSFMTNRLPKNIQSPEKFQPVLFQTSDPTQNLKNASSLAQQYQDAQKISDERLKAFNEMIEKKLNDGFHPDQDNSFYPASEPERHPTHMLSNPTYERWKPLTNNPADVCGC